VVPARPPRARKAVVTPTGPSEPEQQSSIGSAGASKELAGLRASTLTHCQFRIDLPGK